MEADTAVSLLLRPQPTATAPTTKRGRWGVRKIVYLVDRGEKHDLAWWQRHLADNWEQGG